MTKLYIPKEIQPGEQRVAATYEVVKHLVEKGFEVRIEAGAGDAAHCNDGAYSAADARVVQGPESWDWADVVVKVAPPTIQEASRMREGSVLVSFMAPARNLDLVRVLAERKVTTLAMELVPRTTRAQSMDALSSQASIAGYKAVLVGAARLGKYFPLMMTAAGTIPPARVVIMGAGVAGLQAIATAKRLGAVVEVSDIREAVKEQVESLGGRFIELPMVESGEGTGGYAREMGEEFLRKQREIVSRHVAVADVVITTAQVPGKKAPVLVTADMVSKMRSGAVIVDLAVDSGGNCELSEPEREIVTDRGVVIIGNSNLASLAAEDASLLFGRNVQALLLHLLKDGALVFDLEDEITSGTLLTYDGKVVHAPTAELMKEVAS